MILYDYDCIVLGDGPAGISAAVTAADLGARTLLLAAEDPLAVMGTIGPIENLPGYPKGITGYELMELLRQQLKTSAVTVLQGKAVSVYSDFKGRYITTAMGKTLSCAALIVATGVIPQKLGVDGEDAFYMNGVYTCMYCDFRQAEGTRVGIVGGSDSACKAALFLSKYASHTTIIHQSATLLSRKRQRIEEDSSITILDSTSVHSLYGNGQLQGVEISSSGSWKKQQLPLDVLFVYIGGKPNLTLFRDHIRTDRYGFIITDTSLMTTQKGVFAAGALRAGPVNQVINSLSDGVSAGIAAVSFLDQ